MQIDYFSTPWFPSVTHWCGEWSWQGVELQPTLTPVFSIGADFLKSAPKRF